MIAQAIVEGMMWLAGCLVGRWSRNSPARRAFVVALLAVFIGFILFGGIFVGIYMAIFGPSITGRVMGAVLTIIDAGTVLFLGPKIIRYFLSRPAGR